MDLIDRFVKDNTDLDQSENRSLLGKEGSESAATMSVTPPTVSRRVEGLTLQELSSCLDACKASGDWLPFKSLIDDVMMSLTAMAGSFSSAKAASSSSSNDVEMKPATPRQEVENEEQKDHERECLNVGDVELRMVVASNITANITCYSIYVEE